MASTVSIALPLVETLTAVAADGVHENHSDFAGALPASAQLLKEG